MSAPFVHESMTPAERAWEERSVSLPAWMWTKVDELVEHHADHSHHDGEICPMSTPDLVAGFAFSKLLGDPSLPPDLTLALGRRFTNEVQREVIASTTAKPLECLDQVVQLRNELVEAIGRAFTAFDCDGLVHIIAYLLERLVLAGGHRFSLVEDINTIIKGFEHPDQRASFMAALERQTQRREDGSEGP